MKRRTMFAIFLATLDSGLAAWPLALQNGAATAIVGMTALSISGIAAIVHDAWFATATT